MSGFDFEFDDFQTKSAGFDTYFEDEEDADLQDLAKDSERRAKERLEGREVTPQGKRSSVKRVDAQEDDCPDRIRVSSLEDLSRFVRVADGVFARRSADDDLVRQSEQDLWALDETEDGDLVIERLYDDNGNPIQA